MLFLNFKLKKKIFILITKGETIHRMYRNHDYFGDGSVHDMWAYDTNDMMLIF